jgi:hypothetical protein
VDDGQAIIDLVTDVTAPWCKQIAAEEREQSRALRRREALTQDRSYKVTLKDAVFAVMEEGATAASGGGRTRFPKRNLYYSVRKLIQSRTSETLTSKYFESLLRSWEEENGPLPGIYCDPRGYFIEPHTGKVVPLGTRQVEDYTIPPWLYNKILYVEKKGFHELFQMSKLAERYDLGIICAEGYAVDAAKLLLARSEESAAMTFVSLHDADPFGYNIGRKLQDADRAAGRDITVINIGLSLKDALDMGLPTEDFTRDRALPQGLELTKLEREYFEGEPCGWKGRRRLYRCRRVELNALAADPDRFLAFVEDKLRQHGLDKKLVPPRKVVAGEVRALVTQFVGDAARTKVLDLLDVDSLVERVVGDVMKRVKVKDLPKLLKRWATDRKPQRWDHYLAARVAERVRALDEELEESARARVRRDSPGDSGADLSAAGDPG